MTTIFVDNYNKWVSAAISFNGLMLIVITYYFVLLKKKIRAVRKKKKSFDELESIKSLNIQKNRFIFLSFFSLIICLSLVIGKCFSYYGFAAKASSLDWHIFLFEVFFITSLSLFNSILSVLIYLNSKITIAKLDK